MKIYFEDGKINAHNEPRGVIAHVDAQLGPTYAYTRLMYIKEQYKKKAAVYTNSVIALLHAASLAWNKDAEHFEIYLRCKSGEWKNIHDLTNRELREGHNIWKLWWSGEFEEKQEAN